MIFQQNEHLFSGARVLDLASHDGRWSFAALQAGALHVEGVEGRPELVQHAKENFAHYGITADRYAFHCDDVVRHLANAEKQFDIILNLGFFYHTLKHLQILEDMARLGARAFIIDTVVNTSTEAIISVHRDDVSDPRNAIDHLRSGAAAVPVGELSRSALTLILDSLGYACSEIDWHANVVDFSECHDYRDLYRGTFLATRRV